MFGRRLTTRRFASVSGLVAAPDQVNIDRNDRLSGAITRGLQGHTGTPYGYDRGDPTRSLTGPVAGKPSPVSAAMATITVHPGSVPNPGMTVQDLPTVDSYRALTWARMIGRP